MNSLTFISILLPTLSSMLTLSTLTFKTHNCPYIVWPAIIPHSGGSRLDNEQMWTLDFQDGPRLAKIWTHTNCTFYALRRSSCLIGDCGRQLNCTSYGSPPYTKAEYELNNFGRQDYYDVSIMDGYNVVVEMTPTTSRRTRFEWHDGGLIDPN